jgi:hypothetical protein
MNFIIKHVYVESGIQLLVFLPTKLSGVMCKRLDVEVVLLAKACRKGGGRCNSLLRLGLEI